MKDIFKIGDIKRHSFRVTDNDYATFNTGTLHKVCSTFALGREMEWSSRLFVIDMLEDHEEGVGTFLNIEHHRPAFLGEEVEVKATLEEINGHEVVCAIEVKVGETVVASGKTGQKIMPREKINQIFTSLER